MYLLESGHYNIDIDKLYNWFLTNEYFAASDTFHDNAYREFGFSLLISFISVLSDNSLVTVNLCAITAFIIYYISFFIWRRKDISILLFLYIATFTFFTSFNTLRQSISCSMVFLSTVLFCNKKYYQSIIFIVLACSMHFTAILIFPIICISNFVNLKSKVVYLTFAILLVMYFLQIELPIINSAIPQNIAGRNILSNYNNESINTFHIGVYYIRFVLLCAMCCVFVWSYRISYDSSKLIHNLFFFGVIAYILLMKAPNIGRISEFLLQFQMLAISQSLFNLKSTSHIKYNNAKHLILYYSTMWFTIYILFNFQGMRPYVPIWDIF